MMKKIKPIFLIISLFLSYTDYAQTKDFLLQKNIVNLVEEMEFMYGYDQTLREYTIFKTFDKSVTNRLENLPDSLRIKEMTNRQFESDSIRNLIMSKYISPKDAEHTARMIDITKKYGFPSIDRIRKYYKKAFEDSEFNPYILLVHSPKEYWEDLKVLMKNELDEGRINKCTYGHLLWHITGRKSFKAMLENGYILSEENGKKILKSTCK